VLSVKLACDARGLACPPGELDDCRTVLVHFGDLSCAEAGVYILREPSEFAYLSYLLCKTSIATIRNFHASCYARTPMLHAHQNTFAPTEGAVSKDVLGEQELVKAKTQ
jgi:hypothetical protein